MRDERERNELDTRDFSGELIARGVPWILAREAVASTGTSRQRRAHTYTVARGG